MKDSRGILQKDFVIYASFLLDFGLVFTWYVCISVFKVELKNSFLKKLQMVAEF